MTKHLNHKTSVATLMGVTVADAQGEPYGRVREFAVSPAVDSSHVYGLALRQTSAKRGDPDSMVLIAELRLTPKGEMQLRESARPTTLPEDETYLLLERDLLDQQIIDVHGHKVVRVNDVDLVWEQVPDSPHLLLRIAEVEVGLRGALRRLLKGMLPAGAVSRLTSQLTPSVIPWDFVDLIGRDPARRVKLKIEQDRLSQMHPSDIADILEDLAPAERHAVFLSLDEEVAAEALEEVEPRMQKALIESLDSEQVAGIVEEMDPAAAADFLAELPEERSEAILEEMDPEERQDVEELLEFSGDNAAGEMTTDYIALPVSAHVVDAVVALRNFEGDVETVMHVYLIDEYEVLQGVVPLVKILLSPGATPLADIKDDHIVSCDIEASGKKVAELFDKYNLRALPVLDQEKKLAGVIYAEQVIAQLRNAV